MKFKKITIKNIASIENAEIDFTKGSIGSQPIFLIYGTTGSGKTTILDAICLALYNNAPRLTNSQREEYSDSEVGGSTNTNSPIVLVRRGTTTAKVVFEFEGNDGKTYVATWEVEANSRGENRGKLKTTPKRTLQCLESNEEPLTKVGEIDARVKDPCCVGLDFNQFCRTTMLAQGEFTKFLKSNEQEKAAILEKLTGTEIYTEIGKTIAAISSKKNAELNAIETQLNNITILSPEEIKQKENEISDLENSITALGKQMDETNAKLTWLQKEKDLQNDLSANQQKLQQLETDLNSNEHKQKKHATELWKLTDEVRRNAKALDDEKQKQIRLSESEETLKEHFVSLTGRRLGLVKNLEFLDNRISELTGILNGYSDGDRTMFDNAQTILEKLNQMQWLDKDIASNNTNLQTEKDNLQTLENECAKASEKANEAQNKVNAKDTELNAANQQLANAHIDQLQQTHNLLVDYLSILDALITNEKAIEQLKSNQQTAQTELDTLNEQLPEKQQKLQQAITAFENTDKLYNKQLESIQDYVVRLRSTLNEGDTCPVCGQKIEKLTSDNEVKKIVDNLKQQRDSAEQQKNLLQQQLDALNKDISAKNAALQTLQAEIDVKNNDQKLKIDKAKQRCSQLKLTWTDNLKNQHDIATEQKRNCETQLQSANQLQQQANALQKEQNVLTKDLQKQLESKNKAEGKVETCKQKITGLETSLSDLHNKQATLKSELDKWVAIPNWNSNLEQTKTTLQEQSNKFSDEKKKLDDNNQKKVSLSPQLTAINDCYNQVKQLFPSWPESTEPQSTTANDQTSWNNLFADCRTLIQQQNENKRNAVDLNKAINTFLQSNPNITPDMLKQLAEKYTQPAIDTIENELKQKNDEHNACKTLVEQKQQEIKQHTANKPAIADADTVETLSLQNQQLAEQNNAANQNIGQLKTQLENNQKAADKLQQQIAERDKMRAECDLWDRLRKDFGANEGKKFQSIAQSFLLDQILQTANHYLKQFNPRYLLATQSGLLVIFVKDLYEGGQTRPITSLSGGESFMISLSLALGLSSFNTTRNSTDTLFIDEGFGTLDSNYVSNVMDTLERLNQIGGRKVGIISHVEQLRERIAAKIHVERKNNTASTVTIE